jgi:ubiquinone/menaquinone biosynthesis C-methylase UbiE
MGAAEQTAGVRATFDLVADDYDNVGIPFFGPIAAGLVDAVGVRPGDRALDLGCGRGAASAFLADAVGPTGSLTATDLSPAMVAHARAALAGRPARIDVQVGDASDPGLPEGAFDVVVASLVVFFLPDPDAALARWVRLLAPGGRLGISTFAAESPQWDALDALLRPFMPPADPRMLCPTSPFASDEGVAGLVDRAGAGGVRTTRQRVAFDFDGFEGWLRFSRSVGQRAAWERLGPDAGGVVDQARQRYAEVADADGRLTVWQDIRYTVGTC